MTYLDLRCETFLGKETNGIFDKHFYQTLLFFDIVISISQKYIVLFYECIRLIQTDQFLTQKTTF